MVKYILTPSPHGNPSPNPLGLASVISHSLRSIISEITTKSDPSDSICQRANVAEGIGFENIF